MDNESKQHIAEVEELLGHATGIGKIDRGECPTQASNPVACTFCPYGHMLDCHYPQTCEEAQCSHYQLSAEEEYDA
jgi:hypothetical protein